MPMKVKSDQIICDKYVYQCAAGLNWFFPIKARSGEVIIVTMVAIYNSAGDNYGICYKGMRHGGVLSIIRHTAAINAGVVQRWSDNNYLHDGCEMGIAVTPNAAGDPVEITIQALRFRDDEYFKAT